MNAKSNKSAGWCSWLSRIVNTDKVLGSSPSLVIYFFFPFYVTLMKLVMWQGYFFVSKKEFHDWVTSGLVMQPVYGVQTENAA